MGGGSWSGGMGCGLFRERTLREGSEDFLHPCGGNQVEVRMMGERLIRWEKLNLPVRRNHQDGWGMGGASAEQGHAPPGG